MKVFIVDVTGLRKDSFDGLPTLLCFLSGDAHREVTFQVVLVELFLRQVKCLAELDGDLLLLKEDKLVVLHVLFCVGFEVGSQLVQIEAVFVVALLVV